MRKGVWKITACALAAGMTFSGMSTVALAEIPLAGFGSTAVRKEADVKDQAAEASAESGDRGSGAGDRAGCGHEQERGDGFCPV